MISLTMGLASEDSKPWSWLWKIYKHHKRWFLFLASHLRGRQGTLFIVVFSWFWRWMNEMVLGSVGWTIRDVLHRIGVSYRDVVACWGSKVSWEWCSLEISFWCLYFLSYDGWTYFSWDTVSTHTLSTVGWGVNLIQVGFKPHSTIDEKWVSMIF